MSLLDMGSGFTLMRTIFGSSLLSAAIAALLWIIISVATGGGVLFSLGGGIALGVVVFIIGSGFRRLVIDRHSAASGSPRLPVVGVYDCSIVHRHRPVPS
jgi:hypothetical protein